ncbi:MAG: hypothetical protein DESF_01334 [Desulfovibrio sp.]
MNTKMNIPAVALGTWSWGVGAVGGNEIFGNNLTEAQLKPVFEAGLQNGLNLWDTAAVYGMGASETILGTSSRNTRARTWSYRPSSRPRSPTRPRRTR